MTTTGSGSKDIITLRFMAAPLDAGYSGNVSGGRVLEWIDKAGFACAAGWSGRYCVTAYVGNVRFSRPVEVGHLVEVTARIVHTGRTSMQILVTVESGDVTEGTLAQATECRMVFVAVDQASKPTPVPAWEPKDDADRERQASAQRRNMLRSDVEQAMAGQQYTSDGTAPSVVMRFLAAPTDVNWGGKVHGGIVMRWIDEAAHVLATSWTGSAANIAVYMGGVRFYRPLLIGHVVEADARLLYTGRKSMHISVHVRSGEAFSPDPDLTTHCLIVFVPLDDDQRAIETRQWQPVSAEDRALNEHAQHLIKLRAAVGQD